MRFSAALITGLCLLLATVARAADPVVSNVSMRQAKDGSGLVIVDYDVSDADGDTLTVALQMSADGGDSWDFPVLDPAGDVGPGILPGPDKTIELDLGQYPRKFHNDRMAARVIASDQGVYWAANSPDVSAVLHLVATDWSEPGLVEKFARSNLVILTGGDVWKGSANQDIPLMQQMKALNPDVRVVGYVSAFSAKLWAEPEGSNPFWHDWFHNTRPYWVYTTEGDTAMTWPGTVVVNILEPECRRAMIETVIEYQTESLNQLDGIYWDYFNNKLWSYGVDMQGEIDMDGDGIGHENDPDELEAYRAAQVELVNALRDSLGEDYLQVFNGQRAYGDSAFASLADGVLYEIFPTLFFPDPDMQHALDPDYENNLFNVRSWLRESEHGPFMVFSNPWQNIFFDEDLEPTLISTGDQFRAVALIVDGFSCWNSHDGSSFRLSYGWPDVEFSLGDPLGPPVFSGDFIRRQFEFGEVEIEMGSGRYPNPFDYRIRCMGLVVEELAIPHHTP